MIKNNRTVQRPDEEEQPQRYEWRDFLYGFGMMLCFGGSGVFTKYGLEELPSPLLGVTIGMIVCLIAYLLLLFFQRGNSPAVPIPRQTLLLQILAGVLVGLATWARWIALDLAPLAIVAALGRLSVPLVLLLAPFLIGQKLERVTLRLWFGAGLIIAGSLLLTFSD